MSEGRLQREPMAVEATELYRFYHAGDDEVMALRGVSLAVRAGEFVAVVGPSGSGKSTLLACLAGLDDPDGGLVKVAGQVMSRRPEQERARLRASHLGVVLQSANLIGHLTLRGNLRQAHRLAGRRRRPAAPAPAGVETGPRSVRAGVEPAAGATAHQGWFDAPAGAGSTAATGSTAGVGFGGAAGVGRSSATGAPSVAGHESGLDIEALLARLGLSGRAGAYPAQLSGGEAVRAGLAVALVNRPPVVLGDEPTAEVDRATEAQLLELLRSEVGRGLALVVATHSPSVAEAADRIITLADGRVVA